MRARVPASAGGDIIPVGSWEGRMPLYEYVCASCTRKFERYVRAWGEVVTCPACEGSDVEKQLSTFAFTGTAAVTSGGSGAGVGGCGCGRGGCGCGH
jgi:putative FmdB family regulatory protein